MTDDKKVELTESQKIWEEIKDIDLLMFSLPNQKVSDFCYPFPLDPSKCFILPKASAVLPALEEAIGKNFDCVMMDKYIMVSRKPKSIF